MGIMNTILKKRVLLTDKAKDAMSQLRFTKPDDEWYM